MSSEATRLRRDFWTRYAELYPEDGVPAGWGRSNAWIAVQSVDLNISLALLRWGVGLWLKGREGESYEDARPRIEPFYDSFQKTLSETFENRLRFKPGTEWGDVAGDFHAKREFDVSDPANWPDMAAWLHYMLHIYLRVIKNALARRGKGRIPARPPKFCLTSGLANANIGSSAPWQYAASPSEAGVLREQPSPWGFFILWLHVKEASMPGEGTR